ncbi:uncharacterized protein SEPMUDRAFT_154405 [Sphaerulina musiva SO2202]|uniref:Anaphase-promoting complex subunit 4 n=1 Tax=Sphaerulina musiva (strain SO2202) TaxID=692275 RepID=M3DCU6_SPHMS|nr:uncharacterized protein SEPMUDRAFT_154405 [Sphaerulina musiva SO2202]EMF15634.1 hypothetical protein SEPMUDRAFT_154405 [Sphaerulina musiva SO2202]
MSFETKILASKRLPQSIKFPFTAYSHKHDLLAVVVAPSSSTATSTNFEVQVFRIISGQVAFVVKRSDLQATQAGVPIEVSALAWRPDGTSLGVGWSDGRYGIYDGASGRQLSLVELPVEGLKEEFSLDLSLPVRDMAREEELGSRRSHISVLGFMEHKIPVKGRRNGNSIGGVLTTDDWYDDIPGSDDGVENSKTSGNEDFGDLPRAISGLDVTTVLPRLSAIPSHGLVQPRSGAGASKFGTQVATDTQFDSQSKSGSDKVQALLACPKNGNVQVLLDDTVKIGSVETTHRPVAHAAHPCVSTHAVLCDGGSQDDRMRVIHVDLPLTTLNGPLLQVIAANTKRIQTLLDYIVQTARCMQWDYTSNIALPRRFVNLLDEDLKNNHPRDGGAALNLYHLAMTGSFHPQVLEWIVDMITETNWKRWETNMTSLYTNIQNHLFVNLLPALDRLSIALVALRGQAKYHEDSSSFECSPKYFDVLLENIDSIRLVAHKMLLVIQSELRECQAFLRWLKMQFDIATAEPFSSNAIEIEEREVPNIDYPLVLAYIKHHLLDSKLAIHMEDRPGFQPGATCNKQEFETASHIHDMTYARTREALEQLDNMHAGQPLRIKDVADPGSLVNISALVSGLVGRARDTVKHITDWQNRMVFPPIDPPSVKLEDWDAQSKILEMSMGFVSEDEYFTSIVRSNPETSNELVLVQVRSSLEGPQDVYRHSDSSNTAPSRRRRQWAQQNQKISVSLDSCGQAGNGEIIDAKFVPGSHSTLLILFRPQGDLSVLLVKWNIDSSMSGILHRFLPEDTFDPEKLLVGGRRGKLVCVVFGSRGREWRVLDLDGAVQYIEPDGEQDTMMVMQ